MIVKKMVAPAGLVLCLGISTADAQTVIEPLERPDPATVILPDMTFKATPSDVRRFEDYYYFHKPGVSYERAFADLEQCRVYAAMAQMIPLMPTILPIGDVPVQTDGPRFGMPSQFGYLGGVLANSLIAAGAEENSIATNRRCMIYKGYHRYGTSRDLFKKIDSGGDAEKQARKALIASGAQPAIGRIDP